MAALKISNFLGETPRTAERLLPDTGAQAAENVNLTSGEIRPVRPPLLVHTPSSEGPYLAAYRAVYGAGEKWRTWHLDVDIAKAPFSSDIEPRYYWTGDGEPKYSTYTNFGTTDYVLGIPTPQAKPAASAAGGVGTTINRTYCYTFYLPSTGEESAPSEAADIASGKIDGTWTVTTFSAAPANSGTGTAAYSAPDTTFTNAAAAPHWLRVGDPVILNSTTLTVTAVPTASTFKVSGNYSSAVAWARVTNWNTSGLYQRLYRTSGTAATFQLVAERAASAGNWTDTILDAAMMGDELISIDWTPPPVGLTGIIALPNGAMAGFVGNLLCFSEPYQPHAWPTRYQCGTDYPIVGISNYGTTVVVATSAWPYIADGVDPSVVQLQQTGEAWPCLAKRSVASVGDGVIFATTHGLAFIGSAGSQVWTKTLFTREEWEPLNPATMICTMAESKVFVAFTPTGSATQMLVFHPSEQALLTRYALSPAELYVDPAEGRLYVVDDTVERWDAGVGERLLFNWLSKEIELPELVNFGAAKIDYVTNMLPEDQVIAQANYEADLGYNVSLIVAKQPMGAMNADLYNVVAINGAHLIEPRRPLADYLAFTLYVDGREVYSKEVYDGNAFRLPAGYKRDFISLRLTGNVRVKSVKMAETMIGLKQV